MRYVKCSLCYLVALLLVVPTSTYASFWSCSRNEHIREVAIEYASLQPVPCRVVYSKPTEDAKSQLLWMADKVEGYCEEKAIAFIDKLVERNWDCSYTIPNYEQSVSWYMQKSENQKSPFSISDEAVMDMAAKELAANMPEPGIKIGKKAPDFILKNAFGKEVSLIDKLEEGPVVLVFYRGAWCPFCNMHLHALQKSLFRIKKYGAQIIAITPQTPDKSAKQLKEKGYPFEVLSDLDSKVMKAYNLYFELPAKLVEVYKNHGLDIEAFNGYGRAVLPVPGTFVIDTKGVVRAMHADTDYKARMEPAAIVDALENMKLENISKSEKIGKK
jgi:peroxiredoxin